MINVAEAIRLSNEAADEHDVCPECGEPFEGTDMSYGGDLVFIHEDGMCSIDGYADKVEFNGR